MAKSASKSPAKSAKPKPRPKPPIHVLYGPAIKDAAASGNLRAMKIIAAKGRKHLADVQAALTKLEAAIAKAGG